jgi:hypothetical protein
MFLLQQDHVSHSYKTTGKIIILNVNICSFVFQNTNRISLSQSKPNGGKLQYLNKRSSLLLIAALLALTEATRSYSRKDFTFSATKHATLI